MPTGNISSEDSIIPAAFELGVGMREFVAFDCSLSGLTSNLYHEIWHATENKIDQTDYDGLYSEEWDACNPEGYEYLYSYDMDFTEEDLWRWTYFGGAEDIYFVDEYSNTYPKEDRARIMEYIMDDDAIAQALLESPAIRAKFQLMCDGIRTAFDTSGWETVHWERYS